MTKIEIVKQLEYNFSELNLSVRAKIRKYDDIYDFIISHYYKPKDGIEIYYPGNVDNDLKSVEYKLDYYMKNFTPDYKENTSF